MEAKITCLFLGILVPEIRLKVHNVILLRRRLNLAGVNHVINSGSYVNVQIESDRPLLLRSGLVL